MVDKPVVTITGAAGGLGTATARAFAAAGYDLALTDIDSSGLSNLASSLTTEATECLAVPGDLADLHFCEYFIDQATDKFSRIDVLVNNAAWRETVTMREITPESWDKTLRICLTAPAFLSRWAAKVMESRRQGVIVNIGSIATHQAAGIGPSYVAAKGGLNALTLELAALYGPSGVRVFGIDPGAIDSAMSHDISPGGGQEDDPLRQFSNDMISLGRWAKPEEIADLIVALTGDAGSYLTGTIVLADGGWHHQSWPVSIKRQIKPGQF